MKENNRRRRENPQSVETRISEDVFAHCISTLRLASPA